MKGRAFIDECFGFTSFDISTDDVGGEENCVEEIALGTAARDILGLRQSSNDKDVPIVESSALRLMPFCRFLNCAIRFLKPSFIFSS